MKIFLPLFSAVFNRKQLESCPEDDNQKIFDHLTRIFSDLGIPNDTTAEEFFHDPEKTMLVFHKIRHYDISHFREKLLDPNFSDQDIIEWANTLIKQANKINFAASIYDPSLSNGKFFLDLLYALSPQSVSYSLVAPGETEQQKQYNAKYVISITWRLGVNVFLVWEDIVELNISLILAFLCSLVVNFNNDQVRTLPSTFKRNKFRKFHLEPSPFAEKTPPTQTKNLQWVI